MKKKKDPLSLHDRPISLEIPFSFSFEAEEIDRSSRGEISKRRCPRRIERSWSPTMRHRTIAKSEKKRKRGVTRVNANVSVEKSRKGKRCRT